MRKTVIYSLTREITIWAANTMFGPIATDCGGVAGATTRHMTCGLPGRFRLGCPSAARTCGKCDTIEHLAHTGTRHIALRNNCDKGGADGERKTGADGWRRGRVAARRGPVAARRGGG